MNRALLTSVCMVVIVAFSSTAFCGGNKDRPRSKRQKYNSSSSYKARSNYYPFAPALRNLPEGIVLDTKTSRVEVYPGGALIERISKVDLSPGEHRIVIPGLPNAVQAHSLHISGFNENAVAGSTFLESGTLVESRPRELVELEEALFEIQATDNSLASYEETLNHRRELVLTNLSQIDKPMVSNTEKFRSLLNFGQNEMRAIDEQLLNIRTQRNDIAPQLDTIQKKYKLLRATLQRSIKHVVVEVKVKTNVKLDLAIRYYISGPSWEPRHIARYDASGKKLVLETYAWVVQDTGEEWNDVNLRVSTAEPPRGLLPPGLASKELGLEKKRQKMAGQANQLREVAKRVYHLDKGDVRYFNIADKTTINFGKRGKRVLLQSITLNATDSRVAVPGVNPKVYLMLTVVNPDIVPILQGTTSLFNGTDYVGTAKMPRVLPGESIMLPFGNDAQVVVQRVLVERKKTTKAKKQTISVKHHFEVTNLLSHPVTIEVQDRVPFSKDKRVRVTKQSKNNPPVQNTKGDPQGMVRWMVDVAAGAKESWDFSYEVAAPEGQLIIGLD